MSTHFFLYLLCQHKISPRLYFACIERKRLWTLLRSYQDFAHFLTRLILKIISVTCLWPGLDDMNKFPTVKFSPPRVSYLSIYANNIEWSQTEKDKYHMILLTCGILKNKWFKWTYLQNSWSHRCRNQTYGYWGESEGGMSWEIEIDIHTLL